MLLGVEYLSRAVANLGSWKARILGCVGELQGGVEWMGGYRVISRYLNV
jgi:hypothetical protein